MAQVNQAAELRPIRTRGLTNAGERNPTDAEAAMSQLVRNQKFTSVKEKRR
jgi:hypothetical protein